MSTPLGWGLAAREALGQVSRVLLSHDSAAIREVFGHSPVLVDQPSLTHTAHHRLDLGPVADLGGSHPHHMLDYMLDLDGQAPPPPFPTPWIRHWSQGSLGVLALLRGSRKQDQRGGGLLGVWTFLKSTKVRVA